MMRVTRGLLSLVLLLLCAACASAGADPAGSGPTRSRPDLITAEELRQRGRYGSLYELIEVLRPRWLRSQGPDSFIGPQGRVQVHMDGNRLGSVDALRNLSSAGVTSIQWIAPIDAAARFGLDHSHGAIIISTAPVH